MRIVYIFFFVGYGNHVEFHPNGNFIGSGMSNFVIKLYDIRNYKLVQYYQKHSGPVNRISFHPNGKYMISASSDGSMKVKYALKLDSFC